MEIIVNFGGCSNCDALNSGPEEKKKKKPHLSREALGAF